MFPLKDDTPVYSTPVMTILLIVLSVLVYIWQSMHTPPQSQAIIYSFGFIPATLFTDIRLAPELAVIPPWLTPFTSMFLHADFWHLLGNMLFLWIFGSNIEDYLGKRRFTLFYLFCGLMAATAQALPNPAETIPMIGASGAVAGVLGAYLLLFPHARVLIVIPILFYPLLLRPSAMLVLSIWFLLQLLNSVTMSADEAGVAWHAHIGGFMAGMLTIRLFRRRHRVLQQTD